MVDAKKNALFPGLGLALAVGLSSAGAQAQTLAGVYQSGHQVNSLQVCETGQGYLLRGSALDTLWRQVNRLRSRQNPYPMLYVQLEGKVSVTAAAKAADYDGEVMVQKLLSVSTTVPEACMASLGIK